MARHRLPSRRRKSPAAAAAGLVAAAVFFAVGASTYPLTTSEASGPAANVAPCCLAIVAAPAALSSSAPAERFGLVSASRLRVVSRSLPAGVVPESGLQVRTIQAARSISDAFPQIHEMGGVRSDALRWHPNGLALDVIIPNPGSADGIALGNAIVAYALDNAARFGLQDAIWRGRYFTPGGAARGGYGHYDHVHLTTTGGGYPTGQETYFR
ncbi:MAG TPA: hypothetical protein VFR27_06175 [Mycobacterium sp.]|nr:hypothetical protein [Mycobacterium sp.]